MLKKGSTLSIRMIKPHEVIRDFEMTNESYSLEGFVANFNKYKAACINPEVLNTPTAFQINKDTIKCSYVFSNELGFPAWGHICDTYFNISKEHLIAKCFDEITKYKSIGHHNSVTTYISEDRQKTLQVYNKFKKGGFGIEHNNDTASRTTYDQCANEGI